MPEPLPHLMLSAAPPVQPPLLHALIYLGSVHYSPLTDDTFNACLARAWAV